MEEVSQFNHVVYFKDLYMLPVYIMKACAKKHNARIIFHLILLIIYDCLVDVLEVYMQLSSGQDGAITAQSETHATNLKLDG